MLKMVAGDPGNQLLIIGLSFNNLDKFKAEPHDTYIAIRMEELGLTLDVILYSGDQNRVLGTKSGRPTFMLGLGLDQIDRLRQNPGKHIVRLDKSTYGIGVNIVIFSGETEATMTEEVQELIGSDTLTTMSNRVKN